MEINNVFQQFINAIGSIIGFGLFLVLTLSAGLFTLGLIINFSKNAIYGNFKWEVKPSKTYKHKIPKDSAF